MTLALTAFFALQAPPSLESEMWVGRLQPKTEQGLAAQAGFTEAISRSRWEEAFHQAGIVIDSMGYEPYAHVQIEWKRYELLLLADRADALLAHAKKSMLPLGTFEGKLIRRPLDYHEMLQKYHGSEGFKKLSERYPVWSWAYGDAAKYLELAAAMNGDFHTSIFAVTELESIPVMCGTGMEPIEFGWKVRKAVWRAAVSNPKALRAWSEGGFPPLDMPMFDKAYQARYASIYALFAEACIAPRSQRVNAFNKLANKIQESQPVNQEGFLLRLALDRSMKKS